MAFIIAVVEAIILSSSLSLDAFVASFAYGANKIKIPPLSIIAINIVCSGILGISLLFGAAIRPYLPAQLSSILCFIILFLIGLVKLLDNITKAFINKHADIKKKINFSLFNFKFVLSIYANPEKADADSSKILSACEACSLALALSLDGMAVGFGAALGDVNSLAVFIASFFTDTVAVALGVFIGRKLSTRLKFNISWLSGVILIILAFTRII